SSLHEKNRTQQGDWPMPKSSFPSPLVSHKQHGRNDYATAGGRMEVLPVPPSVLRVLRSMKTQALLHRTGFQIDVLVGKIPIQSGDADQDEHYLEHGYRTGSRRSVLRRHDLKQSKKCGLSHTDARRR